MLIFAVAAAGVVSLVASAVRAGIDADLRSAATALAAATLARMATDDFATLAERYEASRDGAGYRALATRARLLRVTTSVNLPSLSITDGPSISSRRVDVVVSWQPPGAARPHRASMTTVIAR
jgi:Tfp pilus assembly protein PilV